jgi:hypothetical protein
MVSEVSDIAVVLEQLYRGGHQAYRGIQQPQRRFWPRRFWLERDQLRRIAKRDQLRSGFLG